MSIQSVETGEEVSVEVVGSNGYTCEQVGAYLLEHVYSWTKGEPRTDVYTFRPC